ncbi:MAG: hypothetical protein ACLRPX_00595 [Ruthenibacterium sp.]
MLTAIKNNRSLSFYQTPSISYQSKISTSYTGGISSVALSNTSFRTAAITTGFNRQQSEFFNALNAERERLAEKVAQGLAKDPFYTGARNDGVSLAWDYEAADIRMGGSGSENWTAAEQQEILGNRPDIVNRTKVVEGKTVTPKAGVRGSEGHHQKNVADHPEQQADPDNIKFYRTKQQHKDEGHGGNWQNESNRPGTDKNKMLEKTNSKRVFKNELRGLGIAVAIGLGVGMTIGFVTTLAQSGVTPDSLKLALAEGAKGGLESGILSGTGYGISRSIGPVLSKAIAGVLENIGVTITENISKMISMGVAGALTIVVFSVYQFIKLKRNGAGTKAALIQVGKQALFSLSLLAVSIAATCIYGGPAGIIVSVSVGIFLLIDSVADSVEKREFADKVQRYMIEKCYPSFAV